MCLFQLHSKSAVFFLLIGIGMMERQKFSFQLLQRSSNPIWHIFFREQELLSLSDGGQSFAQSDSPVSDQICWLRWWSGVRDQAQGGWRCTFWMVGSNQVHCWCILPNQTELGDCLDYTVWDTDTQRLFFNWYMKCIRFPSGSGNAGLAIIPTGCFKMAQGLF